ncbi:serine/threonine protein kinase [Pyxidicoccus sp. 3LFB2]
MSPIASSAGAGRCIACEGVLAGARCAACGAAARVRGYQVRRVVAQGQLGRLYLAEDASGRKVALKELVLLSAPDVHHLEAFEREAKVLARLSHPRIPELLDFFQEGEGAGTRLYLAQEFIEGESLLARLQLHRYSESEARDIARKVLSVLLQLHAHVPKLIHRDIKPANLIQRPDGALYLVDLGSARELAAGSARGATMTGTYGYAPLEQLAGHVTEWCDLHAVGATLLHLLTRQPPWELFQEGQGLTAGRRIDVSEGFQRFIDRLITTDETRRFTTAREALRALDALEAPRAPAPHETPQAKRWPWALLALPLLAMAAWGLRPRPVQVSGPPAPPVPVEVAAPRPTVKPPEPVQARVEAPIEAPVEESLPALRLEVDEQVSLASVSGGPVLTFRLERVSLGDLRGPRRDLLLEGHCEAQGVRKRCPDRTWLRVSDEAGQASTSSRTFVSSTDKGPGFDFSTPVQASARRFLITVGDVKLPDVRWMFDAQARTLEVAR